VRRGGREVQGVICEIGGGVGGVSCGAWDVGSAGFAAVTSERGTHEVTMKEGACQSPSHCALRC
jgi:hypothetical protein